jgi:hypothetical protein
MNRRIAFNMFLTLSFEPWLRMTSVILHISRTYLLGLLTAHIGDLPHLLHPGRLYLRGSSHDHDLMQTIDQHRT